MTAGGAEKSQKCHKHYFNTVNLLPNELRLEHAGAKLASWPWAPPNLVTPLMNNATIQTYS